MGQGGKRVGAGRPQGSKNKGTLDKEAARALLRERVIAEMLPMVAAQVANAKGLSYLVYRDKKTGKFERVKDIDAVNQDDERIEVWEKDPSVQAFTDLMNRALDKPAEHVELTGQDGAPIVIKWQS